MYLKAIKVRNFRGIPKARLTLEQTTVLIGENDCGKSSLLDALSIMLAPEPEEPPIFEPYHFHHKGGGQGTTPAGPIFIELDFEELQPGEWTNEKLGTLVSLFDQESKKKKRLRFRMSANPPRNDKSVPGRWRIQAIGSQGVSSHNSLSALAAIRRLNPLVWLRGGALLAAPAETETHADAQIASNISELADDIGRHYGAIISGRSKQPREELKAGFEAARSLLIHEAVDARISTEQPISVIAEILGGTSLRKRKRLESLHGSAAQQMGILILTAAILRQASLKTLRDTRPILVIEDPEAGLHAMTLSSVWGLLERIEAQKIITTQSGMLLSNAPLHQVRRITREDGEVRQSYVRKNTLRRQDLRKISYHLRIRQGAANFARCWLLVEGETEFWLLPELARSCGYNFDLEGVACVEFAQCGVEPLIKLAREWGIEWTVLVDGDYTGQQYAETARQFLEGADDQAGRLTILEEDNIEECFWEHGYKQVFVKTAKLNSPPTQSLKPKSVIKKAIERYSKPYLAFELIQAASAPGSPGVPDPLGRMIETCVRLARGKEVKESLGTQETDGK